MPWRCRWIFVVYSFVLYSFFLPLSWWKVRMVVMIGESHSNGFGCFIKFLKFSVFYRTNKYLQKSSVSRVCAVGGFFISIPVFLTGKATFPEFIKKYILKFYKYLLRFFTFIKSFVTEILNINKTLIHYKIPRIIIYISWIFHQNISCMKKLSP